MKHFLIVYAILAGFFVMAASKPVEYIRKVWRTLFPRTIRQFEQAYCSICDGRIWFWQSATRLYSLGMTRAHIDCAANYIRSKLEEDNRVRLRAVGALLGEVRQGLKNQLEGTTPTSGGVQGGKHEKHHTN